jgi:exopolysaccharide biosynthesis protein
MTLIELADFMRSLGAYQALNFDGGGSSTLIVQGVIVNSPSDVTLERGIGNAVLITRPKP